MKVQSALGERVGAVRFRRWWTEEHRVSLPSPQGSSEARKMSSISVTLKTEYHHPNVPPKGFFLVFYCVYSHIILQLFSQRGWQLKSCNLNKILMFFTFWNVYFQPVLAIAFVVVVGLMSSVPKQLGSWEEVWCSGKYRLWSQDKFLGYTSGQRGLVFIHFL